MEITIKLNPVITTLEDGSKIDEYELSINNGTNLYTLKNVKSYEEVESSILDFVRGQADNIKKEFTKKADSKLAYIDSLMKDLDYDELEDLVENLNGMHGMSFRLLDNEVLVVDMCSYDYGHTVSIREWLNSYCTMSDIRKLDSSLQTILEFAEDDAYAGKPMEGPEELAKYLADEGQTFKPGDWDIYLEEYNKFKEEQ